MTAPATLQQRHPGLFRVDERVVAVCGVLPVGHLRRRIAYGPLGPVVGSLVGMAIGGRREPPPVGSCAAAVPAHRAGMLIRTDQRLLLTGLHVVTGRPTRVVAEWTSQQVLSTAAQESRVVSTVRIRFTDGSIAEFQTLAGHRPTGMAGPSAATETGERLSA